MAITVPTVLKQVTKPGLQKEGERRRGSTLRDHPRLVDFTIYQRGPLALEPHGELGQAGSGPRGSVRLREEGGERQSPAGFGRTGSAGLHARVSARAYLPQGSRSPAGQKVNGVTLSTSGPSDIPAIERWGFRNLP